MGGGIDRPPHRSRERSRLQRVAPRELLTIYFGRVLPTPFRSVNYSNGRDRCVAYAARSVRCCLGIAGQPGAVSFPARFSIVPFTRVLGRCYCCRRRRRRRFDTKTVFILNNVETNTYTHTHTYYITAVSLTLPRV